ncbi:hypothetical protein HZS_195 [Henneguya salminicola]|nr:hypothetical protein HZS_195 [Henneguya salminicola]
MSNSNKCNQEFGVRIFKSIAANIFTKFSCAPNKLIERFRNTHMNNQIIRIDNIRFHKTVET